MVMAQVVMPRLDPGMQSGKIVEWLKKEGDVVQKGEAILVVEGEKTTFEVEAPESGVLSKILVSPGTDVEVSHPVPIIRDASAGAQVPPTSQNVARAESPQSTVVAQVERAEPVRGERVIASPAARRLAQELGVDIAKLKGTGPGGRISREDVLAAVEQVPSSTARLPSKISQPTILRKARLEGIRKVVAERLGFS